MRWSGPLSPTPEPGGEHRLRRLAEGDRDDPGPLGHPLAGAQVERHAGPAPVVDEALQRDERLGLGVGRDARLVVVAGVLAAHDVAGLDRLHRAEHLVLLAADGGRLERGRRLHRGEREDLEQVRHDHVAVGTGRLVEVAPLGQARGSRARRSRRGRCCCGARSARTDRWRSGRRGCSAPAPCPGSGRSGRSAPRRRPRAAGR